MFLAWNYTLESFLWIIVGAIILISFTVLLARPKFRSKKSEISETKLLLTGKSVGSPKGRILDQDTASGRIEEELEILEEIGKKKTEEVTPYMGGKAATIIFGYSLFSLFIFYIGLAWESRIEDDPRELDKIFSFLLKCLLLINGFTLYYAFYQNNTYVLKISGRIVAFIFFIGHEDMIMSSPFETSTFFWLGFLALLFSSDLKLLWSHYKNRIAQLAEK